MELNYEHAVSFFWSRNIYKTLSFYENILGFKKIFESDGWIEMSVPGLKNTYIAINNWNKESSYPVNEFITLGVKDINSFREYLSVKGVKIKKDFEAEGIKMLKFFDCDNNIVTVSEIQN